MLEEQIPTTGHHPLLTSGIGVADPSHTEVEAANGYVRGECCASAGRPVSVLELWLF